MTTDAQRLLLQKCQRSLFIKTTVAASMASHTIIPGLASQSSPQTRKSRPILLMAASLMILGVAVCVLSQTGMVSLVSFSRLHWNYAEVDEWEGEDCQHGSTQMPVDIRPDHAITSKSAPLKLNIVDGNATPNIFYNGHAVQVQDFDTVANLEHDGKVYKLLQFHFHTPSENRINGKAFAAEVHFVHQAADKSLLVFGVLIEVVSPTSDEAKLSPMLPVFSKFASLKGEEKTPLNGFQIGKLLRAIESSGISSSYYFLPGSLTTPPCTQGVSWTLSAAHLSISSKALAALQLIEGENSRTLQPLDGREVHKNFAD